MATEKSLGDAFPIKQDITELEHVSSQEDQFDKSAAAKVRHRVDWRLIPALGTMYGISLMGE